MSTICRILIVVGGLEVVKEKDLGLVIVDLELVLRLRGVFSSSRGTTF